MKSMKIFILLFIIAFSSPGQSVESHREDIEEFQRNLNKEFSNPEESPLTRSNLKKFKGLDFFPINEKFRVRAKFIREANALPFIMKTTTDRKPVYEKFGEVHFKLEGEEYVLNVYQSHQLREKEEFKDYLFLPFTDATNGAESYGGGRFLDLEIPKEDSVTIDFNKAYNPYCAYNHKYSCPIPPAENSLPVAIPAGVMKFDH